MLYTRKIKNVGLYQLTTRQMPNQVFEYSS